MKQKCVNFSIVFSSLLLQQTRSVQLRCCPTLWNGDTVIIINLISTNKVKSLRATILMPKVRSQIIHNSGRICKANELGSDLFSSLFCEMVCRLCTDEKKAEFDLTLTYILALIIIPPQCRKIIACL